MRRAAAAPRSAGELVGDVGGQSFRRFGFVQSAIVSRWSEIVGERYAKVSSPESIRFPAGRKSGGVLTLLVEGAHAPLIQHLAPLIIERVNRFFGYAAIDRVVFRQGKPPAPKPQPAAAAASAGAQGAGRGPARDRRSRASRLPGVACRANCRYERRRRRVEQAGEDPIPVIIPERMNPMKPTYRPGRDRGDLRQSPPAMRNKGNDRNRRGRAESRPSPPPKAATGRRWSPRRPPAGS